MALDLTYGGVSWMSTYALQAHAVKNTIQKYRHILAQIQPPPNNLRLHPLLCRKEDLTREKLVRDVILHAEGEPSAWSMSSLDYPCGTCAQCDNTVKITPQKRYEILGNGGDTSNI